MSDNVSSPYFYQWDGIHQPFQKPPLPPTPTKAPPQGQNTHHHVRMASLELSDSYSLGSSRSGASNGTSFTGSTTGELPMQSSPSITDDDDDDDLSNNLPSEISDYYERRLSIKRHFPPLPPIPTTTTDANVKARLPIIDEVTMFSVVSSSKEDLESSYSDFDWSRPQYSHLKKRECSELGCWGLFLISLLAVPFSLCIYLGWLDNSVGVIPRGWKIANLVSFCVLSLGGVAGIIVGLAIGLS